MNSNETQIFKTKATGWSSKKYYTFYFRAFYIQMRFEFRKQVRSETLSYLCGDLLMRGIARLTFAACA